MSDPRLEQIEPLKAGEVIRFTDDYVLTARESWQTVHDADVRHIQQLDAKVDRLEAHVSRLIEALCSLKRGDCWCEVAIGNPMMGGRHSSDCEAVQLLLASPDQEPQPK